MKRIIFILIIVGLIISVAFNIMFLSKHQPSKTLKCEGIFKAGDTYECHVPVGQHPSVKPSRVYLDIPGLIPSK